MYQKIKELTYPFLFIVGTILTKQLNFLNYNSTDSPDFAEYFRYFEYNVEILTYSTREQGLLYYYLQSWYFYINDYDLNSENFFVYLNKSIQEVNLIIYLIGTIGLYFLFRFQNVKKNTIYLSLLALNFFPISIAMRLVLKPEILGFAMLPWLILCFELFLKTKKIKFLLLSFPFLVISISAKGSILACFGFYFLIFYPKILLKINKKQIFYLFLIFLILFSLTVYEDQSRNNRNLFEIESGSTSRENYDNRASLSNIYNINFFNLITSPVKNNHADSIVAITLLDTFGDYFDIYWDNDSTNYFKFRKEIILLETSENISPPTYIDSDKKLILYTQKNTDLYLRKSFGLILSLFFFGSIIRSLFNKKDIKFTLAPLVGLLVLTLHAITGFPVNNFDPSVGDTFKTLYYSFFMCLAFVFIFKNFIESNKFIHTKFIIYLISMIFILGFPKISNYEYENSISILNNYSEMCEINKIYFDSNFEENQYLSCVDSDRFVPNNFNSYDNFEYFKNKPFFGVMNLFNFITFLASLTYLIVSFRTKRLNE